MIHLGPKCNQNCPYETQGDFTHTQQAVKWRQGLSPTAMSRETLAPAGAGRGKEWIPKGSGGRTAPSTP